MNELLAAALRYRASGLCILPASLAGKHPTLPEWAQYRDHMPTEGQLGRWFQDAEACCVLTGRASGQLEAMDFDDPESYRRWVELVQSEAPQLLARLVIEGSPSGGRHVLYQLDRSVPGNAKLAERIVEAPGPDPVAVNGKSYRPQQRNGRWQVRFVLIETRGEGGLLLCAPSPGYVLEQGRIEDLPVLTREEHELLIKAARSLTEITPEPEPVRLPATPGMNRPGDEFNERGDARALLRKHGWALAREGENQYWRRPGKTSGWSATLKGGILYVFSSNAAPFEPDRAYRPFSVYALLEHGGDFARAASALRREGYGDDGEGSQGVDLSGILGQNAETAVANILTPSQLFGFNTTDDPNTLLGKRWLCRSGSCLVVGQTGIGKSSFSVQAATSWALGEPLFGIAPVRPLKSLIVQAENDVGDLAEMFSGVVQGCHYTDVLHELDPRIVFVTDTTHTGKSFLPWARMLVQRYQPDLVWIDPLFAFLGGNVSDQETVSAFLRNGLGAIAQETGCTWMIVHHANKPPKDPAVRAAMLSGDYSYLGAGSAELANWARAVVVLREVEDSLYELRAGKRGRRAGLVDSKGQPATRVYLRHGEKGICWRRYEGPGIEKLENDSAPPSDDEPEWTAEAFAREFIRPEPKTKAGIRADVSRCGLADRRVDGLLDNAVEKKLAHRWKMGGNRIGYATVPQPALLPEAEEAKP